MDRTAAGAKLRGPALPVVAAGRGRLRVAAGDGAQGAAAFQRAGAAGRRGRTAPCSSTRRESDGARVYEA
jgi:hypothetical protein